jgi:hypothetical protein
MSIEEIKKMLDHGDYIKIARMVGYENLTDGRKYVYRVMCGKIKGNRGLGKRIIEAAEFIAQRNTANGWHTEPTTPNTDNNEPI